jgi:hypothetical protein
MMLAHAILPTYRGLFPVSWCSGSNILS